ncbi:MAG: NAD(+) synthase [Deltaproteobacteria bacterium HGW-Deltaproteobacteria-6]|nr:MAG: NAD(+) synthase [Deltaproteobacteria bacterium HGW-Deltaproteobacteria-6]
MSRKDRQMAAKTFFNLYHQGFIRAAVCIPEVKVADVSFNTQKTIELAKKAAQQKAVLALFPELGLSAYSNEDLFHQDALLKSVEESLAAISEASAKLSIILAVGAPLQVDSRLFNCAVVFYRGKILGVAVKSYLPNYREYYEARQFSPASAALASTISLAGQKNIPFGANLIFKAANVKNFSLFFEICEDVWVPVPPSSFAAMAGATFISNLSASNITIGKSEYRHQLAANQSARCVSAYLYAAAGFGESTTDMAWDGHAMIYENGNLLSESKRFSTSAQMICGDVDLDRLVQDRMRLTTFGQNAADHKNHLAAFRHIEFEVDCPQGRLLPDREIPRFPYIPADQGKRDSRCYEAYNIQVQGLAQRLKSSGIPNLVIGVSGGLDSTHALIVAARTMDLLGLPRTHVKAYTMPAFGTTDKTYRNAVHLMRALGVEGNEVDIKPACLQMLKDIDHPFVRGRKVYDIAFENVQAGQRSAHLFRLANMKNALVVGTGDLSELALGWSTYGIGDHMSHYNVNASVPKTLIQYLIRWVAHTHQFSETVSNILLAVLATEISPELIPGEENDQPLQKTEATIGPYEIQDFNNFYITRFGYLPTKVAFLAYLAWRDKTQGSWPDVPPEKQNSYSLKEIKKWLHVYLNRFFKTSQYKRSCVPNSPKVGSGGSLSPRGDWRAPSDSEATVWLTNWEKIPDRDDKE